MTYNVLWIISDQHTYRAAGCYGSSVVRTPHIDALASEGMRFDGAYTPAPVCVPARDSILCSRYPQRLGGRPLAVTLPTAAHRFHDAGYCTAHIGKMHPQVPYTRGFDYLVDAGHYYDFLGPKMEIFTRGMRARNAGCCYPWMSRRWYEQTSWLDAPLTPGMPENLVEADHFESFVVDCCESFFDAHDAAMPFFLQANFLKPHFPFVSPPRYHAMYDPCNIRLPETLRTDPGIPADSLKANGKLAPGEKGEAEARQYIADYYAATSFMDACLGRLVASLRRRGLWEQTIVIYTSDHGEMLYEYGLTGKFIFREPSVRVPLIMRVPDVTRPGSATGAITDLTDLLPTCLALCGIAADDHIEGVDLTPVLNGESHQVREYCYSKYADSLMIRSQRWKLSRYAGEVWRLYDMLADPDETVNRYPELSETAEVIRMRNRLLAWKGDS